jgi:hypothetical protein
MLFKPVGTTFKIPFGYGVMGAAESFAWNAVEDALLENPLTAAERAQGIISKLMDYPGSPIDFMSPHMKMILELKTNYNFFFEQQIVPDYLQVRYPYNPELQYYSSTPMVYRRAGEVMGMSPLKVQYILRTLMSNTMDQVLTTTDKLLKGDPLDVADTPIMGGAFLREPIGNMSRSVQRIGDLNAKYQQAASRYAVLLDQGRGGPELDRLQEQMQRYDIAMEAHNDITGLRREIRKLDAENVRLRNEKPQGFEEFIRKNNDDILALRREMTDIARRAIGLFNETQQE